MDESMDRIQSITGKSTLRQLTRIHIWKKNQRELSSGDETLPVRKMLYSTWHPQLFPTPLKKKKE